MSTNINVRHAMEDLLSIISPLCDLFVISVQQYCKNSTIVPLHETPCVRKVAGTCECGDEPSGSTKCGDFLD
jgi:hypothetical protein